MENWPFNKATHKQISRILFWTRNNYTQQAASQFHKANVLVHQAAAAVGHLILERQPKASFF